MKKLPKFNEVWQAPFKYDCGYVYSNNGVMAFTFSHSRSVVKKGDEISIEEEDNEFVKRFMALINGKEAEKFNGFTVNGAELYDKDNELIGSFRGWGHLIGSGGLKLSQNDAAYVQDEFITDCLMKLSI